ncbi:hypothetical protein Dimus_021387 [Dionaea muscipula]
MEESDKVMGDVEADKVNGIKDLGSVNAEVGVEAEVESSGEALKNEPIGDLHMEGSVKDLSVSGCNMIIAVPSFLELLGILILVPIIMSSVASSCYLRPILPELKQSVSY